MEGLWFYGDYLGYDRFRLNSCKLGSWYVSKIPAFESSDIPERNGRPQKQKVSNKHDPSHYHDNHPASCRMSNHETLLQNIMAEQVLYVW